MIEDQQVRLEEVLNEAVTLGFEVQYEEGVIKGMSMANVGAVGVLIASLLKAGADVTVGSALYELWSGLVHSYPWALAQYCDARDDPNDPGGAYLALNVAPAAKVGAAAAVALGCTESSRRFALYFGWQHPEWAGWLRTGQFELLRLAEQARGQPGRPLR